MPDVMCWSTATVTLLTWVVTPWTLVDIETAVLTAYTLSAKEVPTPTVLPEGSNEVIDVVPAPMLEFLTTNKSFASRELIVTAVPAIEVSLRNESNGIWTSKISDVVPTPTVVIPNPTIMPLSPE